MTPVEGKVKFLQDHKGNRSEMRLISFLSFLAAAGIAFILVLRHPAAPEPFPSNGLVLVALFLTAAVVPKTFQKLIELKFDRFFPPGRPEKEAP
jgi:hypothetical protein